MTIAAIDVAAHLKDLIVSECDPATRSLLEQVHAQILCLHKVHKLLDGQEYDSDTAPDVERCLREVGFEIRDIDDLDEDEQPES